MLQMATALDGLGLDANGDFNIFNVLNQKTLNELQLNFQSFSKLFDTIDLSQLATPEKLKAFIRSNPLFAKLAEMDEFKELLESPDFKDPEKLTAVFQQSVAVMKDLMRELLAILSDPIKFEQFVEELLQDMDPSIRALITQLLSLDSAGLTTIVQQTIEVIQRAISDPQQLEELRQTVLKDQSLMNLIGPEFRDLIRDPQRWRSAVFENLRSFLEVEPEQDKDAWRRA